jgi:hypothetical protein
VIGFMYNKKQVVRWHIYSAHTLSYIPSYFTVVIYYAYEWQVILIASIRSLLDNNPAFSSVLLVSRKTIDLIWSLILAYSY